MPDPNDPDKFQLAAVLLIAWGCTWVLTWMVITGLILKALKG